MKLAVFSLNPKISKDYRRTMKKHFVYDENKPDVVVSLGGDGTFLVAERRYPGIPKLLVRDSKICNKCDWGSLNLAMHKLQRNEFETEELTKLEVSAKGTRKLCVNEVTIRNAKQTHAIRFFVSTSKGTQFLIGDGVVAATPLGSTGYFYSITKKTFKKGIGVAFNNVTKEANPVFLPEKEKITVKIERGPALLSCDNDEDMIQLGEGDTARIRKSGHVARIVKII